jgi:4-amino-4-deoxy-L-arabinose transferase-like glycosyltransferase
MAVSRKGKVHVAADDSNGPVSSPEISSQAGGIASWSARGEESQRSAPWATLIGLTILAAVLRGIGLDGGLWYDEIRTLLDSVRPPLAQIITEYPGNNEHVLYSVLAHVSIRTFGDQAWSLRLPALLFGVATVPVLFMFARQFVGRREALLACLLLTVSYHHVWFSQNARGYTALAFFALLSSWLLLRGLRRGKARDFACYGIASALGVYTHLTMVFMVMAHAVALVVLMGLPTTGRDAWRRWRLPLLGFALAAAFSLALYAPLLADVQQFFLHLPSPRGIATPQWAVGEMLRGLQIGMVSSVGALLGGALVLCGLYSYFQQSRFLLALFLLPGAFVVVAALVLGRPIFPRFLFFQSGFGVLIVVRGALEIGYWLTRRWTTRIAPERWTPLGAALVALLAALSLASLTFDYRYPKQDFEGAMRFVQERRADGEPVATVGLATYAYREYLKQRWEGITSQEQLQQLRQQGRRVWVLYTMAGYISLQAPALMKNLREECSEAGVFRGTVGGGDITVCVAPATDGAGGAPARP